MTDGTSINIGSITVGTYLQRGRSAWAAQKLLGQAELSIESDVLLPQMFAVHWSVELFLKAALMNSGLATRVTHDLESLFDELVRERPDLFSVERQSAIANINPFNSDDFGGVRYPSSESYSLSGQDLRELDGLIDEIDRTVDHGRVVDSLLPKYLNVLTKRREAAELRRRQVRDGKAFEITPENVQAYIETSGHIEHWLRTIEDLGSSIGPLSNVETPTAMLRAVGMTRLGEVTDMLKQSKRWGPRFFALVREKQDEEWRQRSGQAVVRTTTDQQAPLIYLAIANYPEVITQARLQEEFGWGSTTAIHDALAQLEQELAKGESS